MTKLFVNIDTDDCGIRFLNRLTAQKRELTESDLYPFIDLYAGSGVTDLLICLSGQYSTSKSRVLSDSVFKYEQTVENGVPVDYKEKYTGIYTAYKQGIDPIKVWLDRCAEMGMTPWMSHRMNDRHCSRDVASNLRPEFFYTARDNGWMLGEKYGSYKTCMNFAVPEVRELWLRYIDEQLSQYNVWGVELDFMREIHCFKYLDEPSSADIMTDFIRNVRAVVLRHAEKYGHEIKLGVRLSRSMSESCVFGFDAKKWDSEGLVDMIVVSPRWETNDSDMPIKEWKSRIKNAEIYAGLETLTHPSGIMAQSSADVSRALTNRYLSDGADGMYFFNHYPLPSPSTEEEMLRYERSMESFATCTSIEEAQSKGMRYIVTRQDIFPEGYSPYKPLPMKLKGGADIALSIGKLPSERKVSLIVGYIGVIPDEVKLTVNGELLSTPIRYTPKPEGLRPSKDTSSGCAYVPEGSETYRYAVDTATDGSYRLSFSADRGAVTYIEFESI